MTCLRFPYSDHLGLAAGERVPSRNCRGRSGYTGLMRVWSDAALGTSEQRTCSFAGQVQ